MAEAAEPKLLPGFTLRWELLTALELIDISLKGGLFARDGDAGDGRGRYLSHWCRDMGGRKLTALAINAS